MVAHLYQRRLVGGGVRVQHILPNNINNNMWWPICIREDWWAKVCARSMYWYSLNNINNNMWWHSVSEKTERREQHELPKHYRENSNPLRT